MLEHFDLLLQHDVKVVRESQLRIRHNLIGISVHAGRHRPRLFASGGAGAVPQLSGRHPKMESFAFYDTAGSVKQLVELRDRHAAAIASEAAARYYGAQILQAGHRGQSGELYALLSGAAHERMLDSTAMPTRPALLFLLRTGQDRWWPR